MTNAKSLWHINSGESAFLETPLVTLSGQIQLQSLYSLISLGTERNVALGRVPESLHEKMKVPYMEGSFLFPIKYGYSLIAQSESGIRYHLMHPHQDHVSVDPKSITELPDQIPSSRAALISNMETALTAYWDADPQPNESILIVGFGLIGSLIAGVLKLKGCLDITVEETNLKRATLANQLGFKVNPAGEMKEYDLAFHASATSSGLQMCLDSLNFEGRIIEVSWYGNQPTTLNLGERFHYNRLTIISSQVSSIPISMRANWDFAKRKSEVIRLLSDPFWDRYLLPILPFEQAAEIFQKIRRNEVAELTYLIKY